MHVWRLCGEPLVADCDPERVRSFFVMILLNSDCYKKDFGITSRASMKKISRREKKMPKNQTLRILSKQQLHRQGRSSKGRACICTFQARLETDWIGPGNFLIRQFTQEHSLSSLIPIRLKPPVTYLSSSPIMYKYHGLIQSMITPAVKDTQEMR